MAQVTDETENIHDEILLETRTPNHTFNKRSAERQVCLHGVEADWGCERCCATFAHVADEMRHDVTTFRLNNLYKNKFKILFNAIFGIDHVFHNLKNDALLESQAQILEQSFLFHYRQIESKS